jgi:hypothetical protein
VGATAQNGVTMATTTLDTTDSNQCVNDYANHVIDESLASGVFENLHYAVTDKIDITEELADTASSTPIDVTTSLKAYERLELLEHILEQIEDVQDALSSLDKS